MGPRYPRSIEAQDMKMMGLIDLKRIEEFVNDVIKSGQKSSNFVCFGLKSTKNVSFTVSFGTFQLKMA